MTTLPTDVQTELYLRWENRDKQRYYRVVLSKDLFNDWVIVKIWGSINRATGRIVSVACCSYTDAIKAIDSIIKLRKRHGYVLCTPLPNFLASLHVLSGKRDES